MKTMERGIILYTYNDSNGEKQEWYSSSHLVNYTGAENQHLMLVSDIDELNPTAESKVVSGEGTILTYENYNSKMTVTFPGDDARTDRANWISQVFYNICQIGVVQDAYSTDQTIYLKRCLPVHPDFTENKNVNGCQLEITLNLRGTWYSHNINSVGDNSLFYIEKGSQVILSKSTKPEYLPAKIDFYVDSEAKLSMWRIPSTDGHQFGKTVDWQYGAYLGTDGIAYDVYPSLLHEGPIGLRSYLDLGPSRNADWMWGFYKDQDGGTTYGNLRKLRLLLYQASIVGQQASFQAFNAAGKNITSSCYTVNLNYLDFI